MKHDRRYFLKSMAAVTGLAVSKRLAFAAEKRPPNIVFVLADDLGWAELGCYGNTFNKTPHLDRLAREGMRFTHAYAAAPVCSPYRVSLMTGQWPARVGITDYLRPDDPKHLPRDCSTFPKELKKTGYTTGIIGKWHLTGYEHHGAEEVGPMEQGFDEVIASERRGIAGGSYFHPYHFNPEIKKRLPDEEYLTDRLNLEAVEFIERNQSKPFFLYLSHYAVHTALVGKPDIEKKYGDDRDPRLAAMLESIDDGIGMIRQKLEELDLSEDTVFIFTSDNGGEDRVTNNSPLRAGKSTLFEGGIRVPFIVKWPGVVTKGSESHTPVCSVDFYPSFLEMVGAKGDKQHILDGVSLLPLLKSTSNSLQDRPLYWHYPLERPHFLGGRSGGAVLKDGWKLIEFFDTGEKKLYFLDKDPGESNDLGSSYPERRDELLGLLRSWQKEVDAQDRNN